MWKSFNDTSSQIKAWVLEQVLWAETNLKGKSGADKKAAVIKRLDDLIVLPFYLEWLDDKIIAWLVDAVCDKLNEVTSHNFDALSHEQRQEVIESIDTTEIDKNG